MEQGESARLTVDRSRCEGYGMCEQAAPGLVHLDENDELVIDVAEVAPGQKPLAEAAVHACPVAALRISASPVRS
ncbi:MULTISPECIES: ferredoxin [Amycolatopsis]|uniref:Ferredoxin n=2 Tax=Amycolatopsis TaxID=1813 RepID=A0A1I4C3S5_9PSEU|nr:ferredoxin [Amycolatopsis sacchari]SFK75754.1 ferredoxin [Amycolatopsis sacchari]